MKKKKQHLKQNEKNLRVLQKKIYIYILYIYTIKYTYIYID